MMFVVSLSISVTARKKADPRGSQRVIMTYPWTSYSHSVSHQDSSPKFQGRATPSFHLILEVSLSLTSVDGS